MSQPAHAPSAAPLAAARPHLALLLVGEGAAREQLVRQAERLAIRPGLGKSCRAYRVLQCMEDRLEGSEFNRYEGSGELLARYGAPQENLQAPTSKRECARKPREED